MDSAQFYLNGTYMPDYRANPAQCFALTQSSYNALQDTLGGIHPACDTLVKWRDNFFCLSTKNCHNDEDFISGVDCRGNSAIGAFETQAIS